MNKPLVSIVIPTFDRNELVQGAILNALDQSYEHIEVIVVEDGSSSGVDVFIKDLCDDRVIYISHDTNRGLGASRNTGMSLSKGEYIAFLDDDDRWMKDKIRLQVDVMWKSSNKMMMVYCHNVQEQGKKFILGNQEPVQGSMSKFIFQGFLLPSSSMMIPRNSLISLEGHSEELISCVDHDMWMKLAKSGFDMDLVDEGLIYSVKEKRKRMVNQFDERLKGIEQFFKKWKLKVIDAYGIESWIKIERKYHRQTSYGIVESYRRGVISKDEGIKYLKDLFILQSPEFSWFDLVVARFGLRFSTRAFNLIPLGNKHFLPIYMWLRK